MSNSDAECQKLKKENSLLKERIHDLEKTAARQISELEFSQNSLKESLIRYNDLIDRSRSIILEWDTEGNILFMNRWGLELFGYSLEELIGRNVVGTIVPAKAKNGEDLAGKMEVVRKKPGEFYSSENENIRKNGQPVWINWTNQGIMDPDGQLVKTLSIGIERTFQRRQEVDRTRHIEEIETKELENIRELQDVVAVRNRELEELKLAQQALSASESLYRALFEKSLNAVFLIDRKTGRCLNANKAAEELTGRSVEKLRQLSTRDIPWVGDESRLRSIRGKNTGTRLGEVEYVRPDSSKRQATLIVSPIGENLYFSIASDITEQKQVSENLGRLLEFQKLLTDISARFVYIESGQLEQEILEAQRSICEYLDLDLSSIYEPLSETDPALVLVSLYKRLEIPPIGTTFIAREYFPWCEQQLKSGKVVAVSSMRDLPAEAERDRNSWHYYGIKSSLMFPVKAQRGEVIGTLSFDSIQKEHQWTEEEIDQLKLVAQLFSNGLLRKHAEQAIRDSEERFRAVSENALTGIYTMQDGRLTYANSSLAQIFGYQRSELIGASPLLLIHPDDQALASENIERRITGEIQSLQYEVRGLCKNGDIKYIQIMGVGIKLNGRPAIIGNVLDITSNKIASDALKESEEKFRLAFMTGTDALYLATLEEGLILEVNNNFENVFGYPREEVIGQTSLQLRLYNDPAERARIVSALKASGYVRDLEVQGRKKGGELITVSLSIGVLLLNNKKHILGIIKDITERKKAEAALIESQALTNAIINSTDDMIWSVDPDHFGIITFNKSFKDYFLNSRSIPIKTGMRPEDLFPTQEFIQKWRGFYQRALAENTISVEYETFSGTRTLLLTLNLIKRHENLVGISVFGKDITELKKAEAKLLEIETLKRVNQAKTELLSTVAHELKTPLAAIKLSIESLLATDVKWNKRQQIDFLQAAYGGTDRLALLIKDLLDMSRIDAGRLSLDIRPHPVKEILDSVHNILSSITAKHKLEIIQAPDLPPLNVDIVRIGQVITNLTDNAAKFSIEASPILIKAALQEGNTVISVEDSGLGLTPEQIIHLFDRFYQANMPVSGSSKGTGLGLAICRGIIEAHGGKIWIESQPGKGSRFSFSIPVTDQ